MRTFQQGQNDLRTSAQIQGMNTGLQAQQLQNQQAANIKSLGTPNYVNPYSQAAVSGPDYLGAYTTSNAAQIAQQNAANAKTANLQNGLFGLGGSAILGAGGIAKLGSSVLNGATTLGGLLGMGSNAASNINNTNYFGGAGGGWFAQPDTGATATNAANFYGSTYDPLAGWSM